MRWMPFGDGFEALLAATAGDETRLLADSRLSSGVREALTTALACGGLTLRQMERLLHARGPDLAATCVAADLLRQRLVGSAVSYVVCRNINYTNRCVLVLLLIGQCSSDCQVHHL